MITGIQILGVIFLILMIYLTYTNYKRGNYGPKSLTLWMAVWLAGIFLVTFPSTVYGIMETLQIDRTADFFVVVGFAFFGMVIFYLYIKVRENTEKMEKLVRKLAIEKKKKK